MNHTDSIRSARNSALRVVMEALDLDRYPTREEFVKVTGSEEVADLMVAHCEEERAKTSTLEIR